MAAFLPNKYGAGGSKFVACKLAAAEHAAEAATSRQRAWTIVEVGELP